MWFKMSGGLRKSRMLWLMVIGLFVYYAATLLFGYCGVAVVNSYKLYINASAVGRTNVASERKEETGINTGTEPRETKVYRWKGGKFIRVPGFCAKRKSFNLAKLRTAFGVVNMFIHDIKNDIHVSGSIKRSGMWDGGGVNTMVKYLKGDSNMGFLDLGSQLGTYSLVAAKMGRHVVAVDPLVENVLRLCQTVEANNMTDKVTILFTALSDSYRTVSFKREHGNIGGTHIKPAQNSSMDVSDDYNPVIIKTVRLDDILPFVDFKKAFIKIDVESHEYQALKEGKELFSKIDVRGILMEWFQIRTQPNGANLKDFLTNRTFYATDPGRGKKLVSDFKRWPNDILWVKS